MGDVVFTSAMPTGAIVTVEVGESEVGACDVGTCVGEALDFVGDKVGEGVPTELAHGVIPDRANTHSVACAVQSISGYKTTQLGVSVTVSLLGDLELAVLATSTGPDSAVNARNWYGDKFPFMPLSGSWMPVMRMAAPTTAHVTLAGPPAHAHGVASMLAQRFQDVPPVAS